MRRITRNRRGTSLSGQHDVATDIGRALRDRKELIEIDTSTLVVAHRLLDELVADEDVEECLRRSLSSVRRDVRDAITTDAGRNAPVVVRPAEVRVPVGLLQAVVLASAVGRWRPPGDDAAAWLRVSRSVALTLLDSGVFYATDGRTRYV